MVCTSFSPEFLPIGSSVFANPIDNEFEPAATDRAGVDIQMGEPDQEGEPDGDIEMGRQYESIYQMTLTWGTRRP